MAEIEASVRQLGDDLQLDTAQVAELVGVSRGTVQRWRRGGQGYKAHKAKVESLLPPPPIGSKVLQEMALRSPLHAWTASRHLNPDYIEDRKTAFDVGRLAHRMVLERDFSKVGLTVFDWPDWVDRNIVIEAPGGVALKVKKSAIRREIYARGGTPMLKKEFEAVSAMSDTVAAQLLEHPLGHTIGDPKRGEAERSLQWTVRDGNRRPVVCRCRVDWVEVAQGRFFDLKTSGTPVEPQAWSRMNLWWAYALQLAFYAWGLKLVFGRPFRAYIVATETKPPFAISVVEVPGPILDQLVTLIIGAINRYRDCWESGRWPSYDQEVWVAEPPAYKLTDIGMTPDGVDL